MSDIDPRTLFPLFYENIAVASLSSASRWSISGSLAEDVENPDDPKASRKAPIDVRALIEIGRLRGAWATDERCLITLEELTRHIPNAANVAFYLRAATDGLIVIDIEPDCPPEVAADLLALPGALYQELSMSGRGYHVLMPMPANFSQFPVAAGKRVLREEHGWYEILLEHWVTFTRKPITSPPAQTASDGPASLEDLYTSLAEKARPSGAQAQAVVTDEDAPEIPGAEDIIEWTIQKASSRFKTPADFNHDTSRYEFSILATLYHQMTFELMNRQIWSDDPPLNPGERAWLLYQAATRVLTRRAKHNEIRNGRPFLLDRSAALVATKLAETRT